MPNRRWPCLFLLFAAAAAPPRARAADEENRQRLLAMPHEQRALLAEKLRQFEALGRAEQDAVRQLDQKIAALSDTDQAQYRSVLRRYHLWVESLPDTQRDELKQTAPDQRMALVTRLLGRKETAAGGRAVSDLLRIVDYGAPSPFEMAHFYKLWQQLTPPERSSIEKLPPGPSRQERLAQLSHEHKIGTENRLNRTDVDALIARMEDDLNKKGWPLPPLLSVKKDAEKEARPKHALPDRGLQLRRRAAENYHFVEHPPPPVDADHLLQFDATVPALLRATFDHLPPEEARRRLTILYRLVYPHPTEMHATKSATPSKPSAPGATPKGAGAAPTPKSARPTATTPF